MARRPNAARRHAVQRSMGADQWARSLMEWGAETDEKKAALKSAVVAEAYGSIVHGSALTGALGQPVDTGELRDSWEVKELSPTVTEIATSSPYARAIEHNWRRIGRAGIRTLKRRLRAAALAAGIKANDRSRLRDGKGGGVVSGRSRKFRQATRITKARLKEFRASLGGLRFRNGGPHSLKLTIAGWPRILQRAAVVVGWADRG